MPHVTGDHVARNREAWQRNAPDYAAKAPRHWASAPSWGVFGVPEDILHVLPEVDGKDVVELGCGTAYVSAWLARMGARPVGIDLSEAQLATARRMQRRHDLSFPLIQADAETVPLADARFDLAISEYGASIWCDPYRWIPEAARLLRPGGELVFLVSGTLLVLCEPDVEADGPAGDRLLRPYFGLHRLEWPDDPAVDFHLGYGDMIRLLRSCGFEVIDLIEVRPPRGATTTFRLVSPEWARKWPCEEIWKARKLT